MDDLPELPFEHILRYLSLEDRLKLNAVSRSCHRKIHNYKVRSLCFSTHERDRILGKNRLISGAFAQNFISSTRFELFFNTFAESTLSDLKHLRLCNLRLKSSSFFQTLEQFVKLEELDLFHVAFRMPEDFKLNLPMLKSIHLESSGGFGVLTLDTPRLQKVQLWRSSLRLEFVHAESVEKAISDFLEFTSVTKLKNLKYLYSQHSSGLQIDLTLLSSLKQLKEIHLSVREDVSELFEQKLRYDRADLKIYLWGLLLNGLDDPVMSFSSSSFGNEFFVHLAENPSRLADEIPLCNPLLYQYIERVSLELAINAVNRFTDLSEVIVSRPVQNIERFLNFLKKFDNIVNLQFECGQPQDLFNRLPEHCAVQRLSIRHAPLSDFEFLFGLKHLIVLEVDCSVDAESIRKILEDLEFLFLFRFYYISRNVRIQIDHTKSQFWVKVSRNDVTVPSPNAAIQFIIENATDTKS